jgi:hypothetical protein
MRIGAVDHMNSFSLGWVAFVQYERTFWPGKGISLCMDFLNHREGGKVFYFFRQYSVQ